MPNGGTQPNKKPLSREEYERRIAGDIVGRRVEAPKPETPPTPPAEEIEEEAMPEREEIEEEIPQEKEEEQKPELSREDIERLARQQRIEKTPQEQLEKGEVPEYEAQPPEAYKQPPGGPAIKPKKPGLTQRGGQAVKRGASKAGQAVKSGAEKAGQAIAQAAKKIAAQAAQFLAKAAAQAVATLAPYWGPILIGFIAVIIIIVGVVILIRALQTPNAMGSSPVQAADILDDYQLIKTVLSLSDSTSFQNMLANNKDQLMTEITNFEETIKAKFPGDPRIPTTISKLDQAKAKISTYSTVDATKADEIKKLIVDAVKPWAADLSPDMLILPLGRGYSAKNITSGGCYLCDRGSYIHRGIDISVPIGRPYYAAATGKIVYLKDDIPDGDKNEDLYHNGRGRKQNGGFGNAIVVEITEGPWVDYYWELHHLKQGSATALSLSKGSMVQQGQTIGQTGHNGMSTGPHMHFQVDKGLICKAWITLGRPCGNTSGTIDPNIALGWKPCPKGLPCNP